MEAPAADRDQLEHLLRALERIQRGAARGIPAICLGWGTEGTLGLQHQGACLGMHGAKTPADLLAMVRQRLADLDLHQGQGPDPLPAPLVAAECTDRSATKKPPDLPSEGFKGSSSEKPNRAVEGL
jgi:hypothetical protein